MNLLKRSDEQKLKLIDWQLKENRVSKQDQIQYIYRGLRFDTKIFNTDFCIFQH